MAQAIISVCIAEKLKKQFDDLCSDFGMTASTAINVFARAVVHERKFHLESYFRNPRLQEKKLCRHLCYLGSSRKRIFHKAFHLMK